MLPYLFLVTLCWAAFAMLYTVLLRRETFFGANRAYLLGTMAAGLIIPLTGRLPGVFQAASAVAIPLPAVSVGLQQASRVIDLQNWVSALAWVYLAGAAVAALRLAWGLSRLMIIVRSGAIEALPQGCQLVRSTEVALPFSFFRWIFVPYTAEATGDFPQMLAHERAHVSGGHSADVLFLELLCVVFWFHPLVHWYRRSLRAVHEYLADAAAARQTSRREYGLLLLQQTPTGSRALILANHFFQSPLKQRLLMLTRTASRPVRQWKYSLGLLLAWVLWSSAAGVSPGVQQGPGRVFEPAGLDRQPAYPGGLAAMAQFLTTHIRYPEAARRAHAEGLVLVRFVVDENGRLGSVDLAPADRGDGLPGSDFADEAIRVVKSMPHWLPGYKNGAPVACIMTLPIRFKLE